MYDPIDGNLAVEFSVHPSKLSAKFSKIDVSKIWACSGASLHKCQMNSSKVYIQVIFKVHVLIANLQAYNPKNKRKVVKSTSTSSTYQWVILS